jgi:microcystin degradation protein MlrC
MTPGPPLRRCAVASIVQETNTFSPLAATLDDFEAQGLWCGTEAARRMRGTNTEFAGALESLEASGVLAVPIMRAWAMSGGVLDGAAFARLRRLLVDGLRAAAPLDGVVLCLHGALVAASEPAADAALVDAAREAVGDAVPIVVTHDLHANVTRHIVDTADAVIGFHTYPHVDQRDTGRRGAALLLDRLGGTPIGTAVAKRAMLVPAEGQALADEPMRSLRLLADAATAGSIVDVSLFPVQPWLDVPEVGFAVTVTHTGDPVTAQQVADRIADAAWQRRAEFTPELVEVSEAIALAGKADNQRPVLLVHSSDSPTSGCTADSAAVIDALLQHGAGLSAIATIVDPAAVDRCTAAGVGCLVDTTLGAQLDHRWSTPVPVRGKVLALGSSPVTLTGDSMTGQQISMGRWATLDLGTGLTVLITERPAPTFDPAGFRHAGLEPSAVRAVVVRSATMYRAGFRGLFDAAYVLDLPGASTPSLRTLDFRRAPRPLYPLDDDS